jgi:hypothetical protein
MRVTIVTSLIAIASSVTPVAFAQAPAPVTAAPASQPVPPAQPPAAVAPEPLPAPQTSTAPQAPPPADVAPPPAYPTPPAYPPAPPPQVYEPQPPPPQAAPEYPPPDDRHARRRHGRVRFRGGYDPRNLAPGQQLPLRYRYIEGTPLPEGYHIEERANRGLVGGGVALFAVPYLIGAFGAISVQGEGSSEWLGIPLVGPWLALGQRDSSCGEIGEPSPGGFNCFTDQAGAGLLITSGVMQAVGAGMIALGLVSTREYAVADYAKVQFTPVATPSGGWLVLSGKM